MRTHYLLSPLAMLLSVGCANVPHDTYVFTGSVETRVEVNAKAGSAGTFQPGMGGAVGGLVAGLIVAGTSTSHYYVYTFRMQDGRNKEVASVEDLRSGECFDVYAEKTKSSVGYFWKPEEVSLHPSNACNK